MTTRFDRLGLPASLVDALAERDIVDPFPVQAATLPDALAGRDVAAEAPTGSGKTLAFGLAVLARVGKGRPGAPRSLVLAPTRELAEQISAELSPLAGAVSRRVGAVYGGVSYGPQKSALRRGLDVLVATPGRLEDLIAQGHVDLGAADIVVVDEADRMADMGFMPAVRRILAATDPSRQTLLFSATLDGEAAALSAEWQNRPARHRAAGVTAVAGDASHHFWLVAPGDRVRHAAEVITASGSTIVFTRTRHGADRVARQLTELGVDAAALHGGLSQSVRRRALDAFSTGRVRALVATDVAARGIHVDSVACVVHLDPPADAKDYVHRSGRTGRAGAAGSIVSLVTDAQRRSVLRMQQELGLRLPIAAPRSGTIEVMAGGGRPKSIAATSRPATRPVNGDGAVRSIYVANLPWAATTDDLHALFSSHGRVHGAMVVTERHSGRSKGYGFVEMGGAAAVEAVAALHGSSYAGRRLIVRPARPRSHR